MSLMSYLLSFVCSVEACNTLLSRDLKRNLFNLFASWSGQYAKPLGVLSLSSANDDEKLQFCSLQVNTNAISCFVIVK